MKNFKTRNIQKLIDKLHFNIFSIFNKYIVIFVVQI